MTNFPNYEKIKKQHYVAGQDFEPIIVKNVLSENQIEYIYKYIKIKSPDDEKWAGRKSWMIESMQGVVEPINARLEKIIKDATSIDVELNEMPFLLRYSPKYGNISKLFPHSDYRDSQRVTIDVQLNYDEEWPIVVEGKEYILKYNEALIFLGTQQMHWRTDQVLKDETEIDMFIANLHYTPDKPLDEDQIQTLDLRSYHLKNETLIDNTEEDNNG